MALLGILPQHTGPYVVLMIAGFAIGIVGHLSRSRLLVAVGILVVFLAALALPVLVNLQTNQPEPPGPLQRPY